MNRRNALMVIAGGMVLLAGCGKKQERPTSNPVEVKEFHDAVNDGDADVVGRLLKVKPYLANARNAEGQTPLAVAKSKGNDELVDVIQKAGGKE